MDTPDPQYAKKKTQTKATELITRKTPMLPNQPKYFSETSSEPQQSTPKISLTKSWPTPSSLSQILPTIQSLPAISARASPTKPKNPTPKRSQKTPSLNQYTK